jgi:integrase
VGEGPHSHRPCHLRWHDLRHTAVALAIAQGAHPKAIQQRMGHASITVTLDRYGHLFPSLGLQIEEGLDATHRASLYAAAEPALVTPLRDAKMTQLTHG